MHEKRWLRCYLRLLNIVNFWKFSTLGPYNSKTGGRTAKKILLNILKMVKNDLVQTFFYFIFFTTRHKILPFGKKLPRSKIFTQFFFLVYTPLYQNLKSKLGDIHLHTPSLIQELDYISQKVIPYGFAKILGYKCCFICFCSEVF